MLASSSPCSCQPTPATGCKPLALLLGNGVGRGAQHGPGAVVKGCGMLLGEQGRVESIRGCPGLMGVNRQCLEQVMPTQGGGWHWPVVAVRDRGGGARRQAIG